MQSIQAFVNRHFGLFARLGGIAVFDQMVVSGTRFLATLLIGRYCGPEELGIYSLGFSLLVLIGVLQESLVCTPFTVLRESGHKYSDREYAGSVVIHHLFMTVLSIAILLLIALYMVFWEPDAELLPVVWVLIVIAPFFLLREFARRFYFAYTEMRSALVIDLTVAVTQLLGLAALALMYKLDAQSAYMLVGICCAIAGAIWLHHCRVRLEFSTPATIELARKHWHFGRWLVGSQAIQVFTMWSSYWLLALFLSTRDTGIFSACMNIVLLSNPIILGLGNILEPRLSSAYHRGGASELRRVVLKVTVLIGTAMSGFFVFMALFGDFLVGLFYANPVYQGYQHMISILALSFVLSSMGMTVSMALRPLQRTGIAFSLRVLDLVVMLTALVPLINAWGLTGGAYAMLCAHLVGTSARFITLRVLLAKERTRKTAP